MTIPVLGANALLTAVAVISAICTCLVAGFAVHSEVRARRFERAWFLCTQGRRASEAKTMVAPQFHSPIKRPKRK